MSKIKILDLRANHENFTEESLKDWFKTNCTRWVFQLEKGEETGYMHWQARAVMRKRARINVHKRELIPEGFNYVGPTCTDQAESLRMRGEALYQMKVQTRVEGPWTDKDEQREFVPYQFRGEAKQWQQMILDSADVRDSRHINVVIDPVGNKGKSWLTGRAICMGFPMIPSCGDAKELIATVCDILMSTNNREPKLIILDLPRSLNKKRLHSMFHAVEVIKNGIVYDMRYSYKQWRYHSPQIWVMTNEKIDTSYMSHDRWNIWNFDENENLVMSQAPTLSGAW